jgi:hypothetical protein
MADNNFRSYRSRDPLAGDHANAPAAEGAADPLAELARLIGQTDPQAEGGRYEDDPTASGRDWSADDRYADQHNRVQDRYVQPPPLPSDPYPSRAPQRSGYENEPVASSRYFSGPAAKFSGFREDGGDYVAVDDAQYRGEPTPISAGQLPAFAAAPSERGYEANEQEYDGGQAYGADDYNDEAPNARRGGLVVVMAVLGLAVIGTAGAFGYRAMFGSSMLPTLPPIIKASNGPNKIIPSYGDTQANNQPGGASTGSTENLVSREEQPVKMEPPKAAPHVVSTIPISPGQNSAPAALAPTAGLPATASPGGAPPASTAAPLPPPAPAPAPISSEPKKVHTVTIRADQPNSLGAAPVQPAPTARSAGRPASSAPKPSTTASAPAGPNAPLSIVLGAEGDVPAAAPARPRAAVAPVAGAPMSVASATPATAIAATPSAGGGYAVQLTSQRNEAAAQAAFRSLQAKYPNQLGGREPILRRADLGAKGVYYRALVGPFASMEEAAGVCSSLKAAGGNCIVQKN